MPPRDQPGGRGAGQLDDVPPAGVHGEQDAAGRLRAAGVPSSGSAHCGPSSHCSTDRRPPAAGRRRGAATGRTPRCQPDRAAGSPPPRRSPSRATPRHAPTSRTACDPVLRVADHSPGAEPLPADLELRLDHRQQVGVLARAGRERRQHQAQRDEGQVGDHEVDRAVDRLGGQRADVGALVHPHPLVGAQRPGQLAVADVDGDDLGGAAAEQHLGEAAGGGAGVEGAAARRRRPGTRRGRRAACARRGRPSWAGRGRCGRRPGCRPRRRWPAWSRPGRRRRPAPRR